MTTDEPRHLPTDLLPTTCIVGRQALIDLLSFTGAAIGGGLETIVVRMADEVISGQRVALYDSEWHQMWETPS